MSIWSRWKQREYSRDVELDERRFARSFTEQMVEIEGEIGHVIRDDGKLDRIRNDKNYVGEPQTIQRVFEIIKRDPKNIALLREVERAEKETYAFLSGAPDAPSKEEMSEYWGKYMQAYTCELNKKTEQN